MLCLYCQDQYITNQEKEASYFHNLTLPFLQKLDHLAAILKGDQERQTVPFTPAMISIISFAFMPTNGDQDI